MSEHQQIQNLQPAQLSIVLAARNHNPTILNSDFLKRNAIIPEEWQLSEPPICIEPIAQVKFQTGVHILAQPDRVVFSRASTSQESDLQDNLADIVIRYIDTLPHVNYLAVGINPSGYVVFDSDDYAWNYLRDSFLAAGEWRDCAEGLVHASLQLFYKIDRGHLTLGISQSKVSDSSLPCLLFSGNFHRDVKEDNVQNSRLEDVRTIVKGWHTDMTFFTAIVREKFLQGA